ncbi:MAG: membrane protein insertion efficiency factor YidD [Gammaproteobacteria bacterium]|nr:membrane protein insertion efficiency factor YidD [Gammaproteobacteria bacterium]
MLRLISIYRRWISPFLPPHCRYYPTCSQYASEAVSRFGPWKGGWLAVKRIVRCNPFSLGGFDPVPEKCGCQDAQSPTREIQS